MRRRKSSRVKDEGFSPLCKKLIFTRNNAKAVIKNNKKSGKQYRKAKRSYYCDRCGGYHVTSMDIEVYDSFIESLTAEPETETAWADWSGV